MDRIPPTFSQILDALKCRSDDEIIEEQECEFSEIWYQCSESSGSDTLRFSDIYGAIMDLLVENNNLRTIKLKKSLDYVKSNNDAEDDGN